MVISSSATVKTQATFSSVSSPEYQNLSDDELITAYLDQDQAAFTTLYNRHKPAVYGFFLRQLTGEAANDGFQETWSKLIANLANYQPEGKFKSYLFTVAYNVLHDHQRKLMREPQHAELDEQTLIDSSADTTAAAEQTQLAERLFGEIRKLPIAQRSVWLLKQESGLGLKEIANLTNSTVEGVKSRLRYANEKLRTGMQKYVRS
ncbi:MAG: RNA polymerase sigma factor (sigma-70 family) [Limisphaerales bacterium]|jgi:RNA polymerase sigma factor (sigma-70 family)